MRALKLLVGCVVVLLQVLGTWGQAYSELYPLHPLLLDLMEHAYRCREDPSYCEEDNYAAVSLLAVKVANEHTNILQHDSVRDSLLELLELIDPESLMGRKIHHICATLYFAQGHTKQAKEIWYSDACNAFDHTTVVFMSS